MGNRDGAGTPATMLLQREGIAYSLHAYAHGPHWASYGLEAAQSLGVDPLRVLKTLITRVDTMLTAACVPVAFQLDLRALAAARNGKRAAMAAHQEAERVTGYVTGGISPLGQRRTLPTVVDRGALEHASVYVSAGRRGLELELDPRDLVTILAADTAAIARRGSGQGPPNDEEASRRHLG